jgi:hypothetical protein
VRIGFLFSFLFLAGACSSSGDRGPASAAPGLTTDNLVNRLRPFTADGCPHFPFGIQYPNQEKWNLCCTQHNLSYWKGGTADERMVAAKALRDCIFSQNDANTSGLVFTGVRAMDTDEATSSRRWGYGWVINRGYTPLTDDDKVQVTRLEKNARGISSEATALPQVKESLSGNYCVDGVITFIQQQLHRTLTPMRVEHGIEAVSDGFEETVKINDRLYPEPYEFHFHLNRHDACTIAPQRWPAGTQVKIKSFSY